MNYRQLHDRLYLTALLSALLFVNVSYAGVLGRYTVYERDGEVWLVGEIMNSDESEAQGSESSLVRNAIVVASCSASGRCIVQTTTSDSEKQWLPLLTWHNDMPVLLSENFRSGITIGTSERKVILIPGVDSVPDDLSRWRLSGGGLPRFLVARNRKRFGVTREVSGGEMGVAMGDVIELDLWIVSIGNRESDVSCRTITIRSRRPVSDKTLKMAFAISL